MMSNETSTPGAPTPRVIHVDFRGEKRKKPTTSAPQQAQASLSTSSDRFIRNGNANPAIPIRAIDALYLRNKMLDISGWWLRLTIFVTMVAIGYLVSGQF